jgi:hypothetical protein
VGVVLEPEGSEQLEPARVHLLLAHPSGRPHRQQHVLERGEFGQQEMKLEDKSAFGEPYIGAVVFRQF